MPDPLVSLARLRRLAVDETRRALAECLDLEDAAQRREAAIEASIAREMQAASDLSAGDGAVESFGVWLKLARANANAARLAQQRAAGDTSRARAAVVAARAAGEAVETLLAHQATEREAARTRREQGELDEMTRHRLAPPPSRAKQ